MSFQYAGSQFQDYSHLDNHPSLHGIIVNSASDTEPYKLSQHFEQDVETATQYQDYVFARYNGVSTWGASPSTPGSRQRPLNPTASPFQPQNTPYTPPSGCLFQRWPDSIRLQPSWIQDHASSVSPLEPAQAPTPITLQSNNGSVSFTHSDASHLNASRALQTTPTGYSVLQTPPSTVSHPQAAPAVDHVRSLFTSQMQPQLDVTPGTSTLPIMTVASMNMFGMPTDLVPSKSLSPWIQRIYSLGDHTRPGSSVPDTPTQNPRDVNKWTLAPPGSTPAIVCQICGKTFVKRHELARWHEEGTHRCEECGKAFVAAKDLKRHLKKHNKSDRHLFCNVLGCPYSHKGFQRKDHLKRHYERRHSADLPPPAAPPLLEE